MARSRPTAHCSKRDRRRGAVVVGHLSEAEIERLLCEQTVGRLGCSANGRTYVVPVSYVYDGSAIYGHSHEGLKLRMIRQNPDVCFEVDSIAGVSSWKSVVLRGRFEILQRDAAERAMRCFIGRLQPHLVDAAAAVDEILRQLVSLSLAQGVAYRINITEKSGRFEA